MLLARKCTERWNFKNLAFPVRRANYICIENSTIEVNVTGSTVASPPVNNLRQTSMWNLATSWEKAATINPSVASLKGNPFKNSPLSGSEKSETTCSTNDERCVFIHIFVNNIIVFFVYGLLLGVEDAGHITIVHRLTNLLFLLFSSFFCPFVLCCFMSIVSSLHQVRATFLIEYMYM